MIHEIMSVPTVQLYTIQQPCKRDNMSSSTSKYFGMAVYEFWYISSLYVDCKGC